MAIASNAVATFASRAFHLIFWLSKQEDFGVKIVRKIGLAKDCGKRNLSQKGALRWIQVDAGGHPSVSTSFFSYPPILAIPLHQTKR